MNLKNLNPKTKQIILAACIVALLFLAMFVGGFAACKEGGGKLMSDFSCVNTLRLDLCRSPDGIVWQYDNKQPPIMLNLSETKGE